MKKAPSLSQIILTDVEEIIARTKKELKVLENKTILIAGAAGFLPSYLVHTLAYANTRFFKRPCRIICLDNYQTGKPERLRLWEGRKDIKFVTGDVTKPIKIGEQVDYIVHGASIASPVWYRKFPLETIDANVAGTRRLLDLARTNKVTSFLYFSSSEIYGDPFKQFIPTDENYWGNVSPTGPRACYDESKRLAETICMIYYRNFGVPIKIIRPFNVYGPGLRLDDGRVIPDFINDVLNGKSITLLSDGRVTRSFCYIVDAAVAILLLLVSKVTGEAFNVGNDEEVTILKLAQEVDRIAVGAGVKFIKSKEKAYLTDNPQRRLPKLTKIKKTIKWVPQIQLSEGLKRTLKFYQEGRTGWK